MPTGDCAEIINVLRKHARSYEKPRPDEQRHRGRGHAIEQFGQPVPLPVQALDHATGYLIAATVVRSMTKRIVKGTRSLARLSLARTAKLLIGAGTSHVPAALNE